MKHYFIHTQVHFMEVMFRRSQHILVEVIKEGRFEGVRLRPLLRQLLQKQGGGLDVLLHL